MAYSFGGLKGYFGSPGVHFWGSGAHFWNPGGSVSELWFVCVGLGLHASMYEEEDDGPWGSSGRPLGLLGDKSEQVSFL